MTQKPLNAILTKSNKKIHVAISCPECRTVLRMGVFPEVCPVFKMRAWIEEKRTTAGMWHRCPAFAPSTTDRRSVAVQYSD